jgi:hypothetical protein
MQTMPTHHVDSLPPPGRRSGKPLAQILLQFTEEEWRLEPVLQVAPKSLTLLYHGKSSLMPVGRTLEAVRVFSEGLCVLHCAARVQDCTATEEPGCLALTLDLLVKQVPTHGSPAERHDAASIDSVVADLLGARSRVSVTLDGIALPQQATLLRQEGTPHVLVLGYMGVQQSWASGSPCELICDLLGKRLHLHAKLRRCAPGELHLTWPHALADAKRRVATRVRGLPQPLSLRTHMPFSNQDRTFEVIDLSARGVAIEVLPEECVSVGMVLPSLSLDLPEGRVEARGIVRNIRSRAGRLAVGVALQNMAPAAEKMLARFVETHTNRSVRTVVPADLPAIWSLCHSDGLAGDQLLAGSGGSGSGGYGLHRDSSAGLQRDGGSGLNRESNPGLRHDGGNGPNRDGSSGLHRDSSTGPNHDSSTGLHRDGSSVLDRDSSTGLHRHGSNSLHRDGSPGLHRDTGAEPADAGPLHRAAQARQAAGQRGHATLLGRGDELVIQRVIGMGEEIFGTAALLRSGDKTWRLSPRVLRPDAPFDAAALLEPLLQALLLRPDAAFLQLLLPQVGHSQAAAKILSLGGTGHATCRAWEAIEGGYSHLEADLSDETHDAAGDDLSWIAQRCERLFTPLEVAAQGLQERQLKQAELQRAYRALGLDCRRQVRLATSISETLGFSLCDIGLPGLRSHYADGKTLCRLLPTGRSADSRRAALRTLMRDADSTLRPLHQVPQFLLQPQDTLLLSGGGGQRPSLWWELTVERSKFVDLPRWLAEIDTDSPAQAGV